MQTAELESKTSKYHKNGYCIISDAVSAQKVSDCLREINAIFTAQLEYHELEHVPFENDSTVFQNMKKLFDYDTGIYLSAARHIAKLATIQQLTSSKEILNIAKEFGIQHPSIPSSPVVHISSDELVIPGGYYGVSPHQDWPSIQGGLGSIVIWMPFMDVGKDNFPLEIIPGSHKNGLWEGEVEKHTFTIDPKLYSDDDFVRHKVNLGDIIIMSVFTVHRTGLKNSSGLRIASSTRYENSLEKTFVERGYPCAYKRTVEREFITDGFPSIQQVSDIFNCKQSK